MTKERYPSRALHRALTLGAVLLAVPAAQAMAGTAGYLTSGNGQVVTDQEGSCWRTGEWTPDSANAQCNPALVARRLQKIHPAAGTPAPRTPPVPKSFGRVTLHHVTYFAFNKAHVNFQARQDLKHLVHRARDMKKIASVDVTGYTDRIGTVAYNMKLGKRRAEAIRRDLLALGVRPGVIHIKSMGPKDPVKLCGGSKVTGKLIKCLAPDRRTVLSLTATQPLPQSSPQG
ncbi:MAG TPA: OmpA family protein [Gammaproteobacteria bacterium]|nr:OmpA family protein [Gammaproteobacteria bacterium]